MFEHDTWAMEHLIKYRQNLLLVTIILLIRFPVLYLLFALMIQLQFE